MNKLIDYVFHPKQNPQYETLRKHGVYDASRVSLVVCPVAALAMIIFLLVSFVWPDFYGDAQLLVGYRFYYFVVLTGLILYEIQMVFVRRKFNERYHLMPWLNTVLLVLLLWWAVQMSRLDFIAYGRRAEPMLYVVVSICIPYCLYLDVRLCWRIQSTTAFRKISLQ